jgi:NAD(P)-dependent dehydrogenase (short-subunit alcohol dehydrogenase family)
MSNNLEGKVVVITGASSGLGEATARHLSAQGASVVLGARHSQGTRRGRCSRADRPARQGPDADASGASYTLIAANWW